MPSSAPVALDRPTDQRLLLAAERLFAEHGVAGVSLRAVMQAAGANVASVHYHFGSKDGLVDAVVRSRLDAVVLGRDELVAGIDAADPDALAAAFIRPVLDLVDDGGAHWVAVVADLLRTNHPALAPISDGFLERNSRFVTLLTELDPSATPRSIGFRLMQAMSLTLSTLGNLRTVSAVLSRDDQTWTTDEVRDELVAVIAAILAGPARRTRRTRRTN